MLMTIPALLRKEFAFAPDEAEPDEIVKVEDLGKSIFFKIRERLGK
ncbi:MAG: hypothetical protein ACUVQY_10520 [Thermoproteota archaeon]